jgi:2-polyprenyl-3-methyl-5-hydroxy-6-metoxy-1,4-benzoquinol methylase
MKIFISHSSKNKTVVRKLVQDLRKNNVDVWFDEDDVDVGDSLITEIQKGIKESDFLAIWLTKESVESGWVTREWETKLMDEINNKRISVFPLLAEDVEVPDMLGTKLYADFRNYEHGLNQLLRRIEREKTRYVGENSELISWESYGWNFKIDNYRVAYMPLLNNSEGTIRLLTNNSLEIHKDLNEYKLPPEFDNISINSKFEENDSCRLSHYYLTDSGKLTLSFAKTKYSDYLKSGEVLDYLMDDSSNNTYRDEFGRLVLEGEKNLRLFKLSNICGVGLLIISSDGFVIGSKHSADSHVYPNRITFSSSGIMKWGASANPFTSILLKAYQEINHQVDINQLNLIDFGADSRKLYFQFNFIEQTNVSYNDIKNNCTSDTELYTIPFEPDSITNSIVNHIWEPAAEATLLMYAISEFGKGTILSELKKLEKKWIYKNMRDEWDYRANRLGLLPDMSVRYPQSQLQEISNNYLDKIYRFVHDDMVNKHVIEIGCGTGRLSKRLIPIVSKLTCNDLSDSMLKLHKKNLNSTEIEYLECFAQDIPESSYDVLVLSLVLIHNVDENLFNRLIEKICRLSEVIFLFEDITISRKSSPQTKLRSEKAILEKFKQHNYSVIKKEYHSIINDKIIFLKLSKNY